MIRFESVSVTYPDAAAPALSDVDLTIEEGELCLVVGRTGAGKSTLLSAINGLVPHFTGGLLTGRVTVDGLDTQHHPPRELAELVGVVGQDPLAGFVTEVVEEELAYGMEQLAVKPATMRKRVEETLDLLGIADLRDRPLRTLSGGQQQRVAIGSVLTAHPKILVLDEPTSALDPTAAEEVLAAITRLVHDLGMTVVLAEHRLERVVQYADRLIYLPGDRRVITGLPAEVLVDAQVAPPVVELGRLAGWSPLPLSVRDARRLAGGLRSQLESVAPPISDPTPAAGSPLLSARGVVVRHGAVAAVRGVDLDLAAGEIVALMGRNGAGKSSLLWALQGSGRRQSGTVAVRPRAGSVQAGEEAADPKRLSAARARALVGLVPQTPSDLLYLDTVAAEAAQADRESGAPAGTCLALLDRLVGVDSTGAVGRLGPDQAIGHQLAAGQGVPGDAGDTPAGSGRAELGGDGHTEPGSAGAEFMRNGSGGPATDRAKFGDIAFGAKSQPAGSDRNVSSYPESEEAMPGGGVVGMGNGESGPVVPGHGVRGRAESDEAVPGSEVAGNTQSGRVMPAGAMSDRVESGGVAPGGGVVGNGESGQVAPGQGAPGRAVSDQAIPGHEMTGDRESDKTSLGRSASGRAVSDQGVSGQPGRDAPGPELGAEVRHGPTEPNHGPAARFDDPQVTTGAMAAESQQRAATGSRLPGAPLWKQSTAEQDPLVPTESGPAESLSGRSDADQFTSAEDGVPAGRIDPERHPRDLSEGQRLALVLAIQLTAVPAVMVLDEPTRGLDYAAKRRFAELLRELAAEGRAILLATHDVEFVAAAADRVVVLAEGEVVADGRTAEVIVSSPAFSPQVSKVLAPQPWLTVAQVAAALAKAPA